MNGCFILGWDSDDTDVFERTAEFIEESELSEAQITILTPFPNTPLYRKLKSEGRLLKEKYWDECTLFDVTFQPQNMSADELKFGFHNLMKRVYSPENVKYRKKKFKSITQNRLTELRSEYP